MVLLSGQGMDVAQIAKVAFTSPDRVRRCCTTSTTTALHRWASVAAMVAVAAGGTALLDATGDDAEARTCQQAGTVEVCLVGDGPD